MASLIEELATENASPPKQCQVCEWLKSLDSKDRNAFEDHLDNRRALAKLHRACRRADPQLLVAYSTFSRHCRDCRT